MDYSCFAMTSVEAQASQTCVESGLLACDRNDGHLHRPRVTVRTGNSLGLAANFGFVSWMAREHCSHHHHHHCSHRHNAHRHSQAATCHMSPAVPCPRSSALSADLGSGSGSEATAHVAAVAVAVAAAAAADVGAAVG